MKKRDCVWIRTIGHTPILVCRSAIKGQARMPYLYCCTCGPWPAHSRHIVFRCRACRRLCCDACLIKGFYVAYCPHCKAGATLEPIGRSAYLL